MPEYERLKESDSLPKYQAQIERILTNISNKEAEELKGDISKDIVYRFLKKVEGKIDNIVEKEYTKYHPVFKDNKDLENEREEDLSAVLLEKHNFIEKLLSIFETRYACSLTNEEVSYAEAIKLNEVHYNWLETIAKTKGKEMNKKIEWLVEILPNYPFDKFYWDCDIPLLQNANQPVSKLEVASIGIEKVLF
jgi:hypothetical protein